MTYLDQIKNQIVSNASDDASTAVSSYLCDKWNPPFSGDIDICIKANGDWYHEGVKFTRRPLVKLFSSILKKEGPDYFLVTPVEKWRIRVDDAPLLVIDFNIGSSNKGSAEQVIQFTTYADDLFNLDIEHPLRVVASYSGNESRPYIIVKNNLEALINRSVFYELVKHAVVHEEKYGVWSCGSFFKLE